MSATHASVAPRLEPDPQKLEDFVGRVIGDVGTAYMLSLIRIGDKLGHYQALRESGPVTPEELAKATGTHERYVREWLSAHAAAGYVDYDPANGRFQLNPEQATVFADPESPFCLQGGFQIAASVLLDHTKILAAFETGKGVGWHEHRSCMPIGVNRFFRPLYNQSLISEWLPTLDGVIEKLEKGAHVADVGCGFGSSTMVMAKAFPKSRFIGFDFHEDSVRAATEAARAESVTDNLTFEVGTAKDFTPRGYDLVTFFDCLHDMGDPAGAAAHVYRALAKDGTWMIVEPFAHNRLEENLTPVGKLFYAASTMVCTPCSLSQEVGLGLGAQAGEARLREVVTSGGFSRFRRATKTPFNMILEARP